MSTELTAIIVSVVLAVVALVIIFKGHSFLKAHKNLKPVIEQVAGLLPTIVGITESVVTKGDEKAKAHKTFEVLKQIADASAKSVEQLYQKESHLTSEEKMKLAKDNFEMLAKASGIKPSELDEKVVETLIETTVFHINNK